MEQTAAQTRRTTTLRYWRIGDEPKSLWPWGWLLVALLGFLFLWGLFVTAPDIEQATSAAVAGSMNDAGFDVEGQSASGQEVDVLLSGTPGLAADQRMMNSARRIAQGARCDTWVGRVVCPTSVNVDVAATVAVPAPETTPAIEAAPRHHDFRITRRQQDIDVTGEAPTNAERDDMVDKAIATFGGLGKVNTDVSITSEPGQAADLQAFGVAAELINRLEQGAISWRNGQLSVAGLAYPEEFEQAQALLDSAAVPKGDVDLRIAQRADQCNEQFNQAFANATINFRTGSFEIDTGNDHLLDSLAGIANVCPGLLRIEGHTDSTGNADANLKLSQARAEAVARELSVRGVSDQRLVAAGYGAGQPVASNESVAGRAANRRIVISVLTESE